MVIFKRKMSDETLSYSSDNNKAIPDKYVFVRVFFFFRFRLKDED